MRGGGVMGRRGEAKGGGEGGWGLTSMETSSRVMD